MHELRELLIAYKTKGRPGRKGQISFLLSAYIKYLICFHFHTQSRKKTQHKLWNTASGWCYRWSSKSY